MFYKERDSFSVYKCFNKNCSLYISNKKKLNFSEKMLFSVKPFEFKLHYIFREYHFSEHQLVHSAPNSTAPITQIRNSLNTLALILTFHVSFAISARKTAYILREVFKLKLSYQSVLNYCEMTAYHCHNFNLAFKGPVDNTLAGDETYIKISGKRAYTFLFISSKNLKITANHIASSRDTLPATIAIKESIRTADPKDSMTIVTDGNPSYQDAVHFLNKPENGNHQLNLKQVIGLQNLDKVSEEFRPFKQLIERLNRTYKFHVRPAVGFASINGAIALTTLFVTHYNFLRPHMSLNYNVPVPLDFLKNIDTLPNRWAKLISTALQLPALA